MPFFNENQTALLNESLSSDKVKTRQRLSYIEGWHAIAEANRIFGFGMWDKKIIELRHVGTEETENRSGTKSGFNVHYIATVEVRVRNDAGDVTVKQDVGYGNALSYSGSQGENHENAAKEAVTDAVKRCLKDFGNVFGLALYDKDQENVESPQAIQKKRQQRKSALTQTQQNDLRAAAQGKNRKQVGDIYRKYDAQNPEADVDFDAMLKEVQDLPDA